MSINAHLAVMRSAFSTATAAAKVPDGRVSNSIASRESACNVFIGDAAQDGIIFALVPSISCGMVAYDYTGPRAAIIGTGTAANPQFPAVVNATALVRQDSSTTAIYDSNNAIANIATANAPDRYRVVSAALRLSCINASEYNNGWFEAIRVPSEYTSGDMAEVTNAFGPPNSPAQIGRVPANGFENGILISSRWCTHPSYVTGKLSNLYKHQFYLQPQADREFVRHVPAADNQHEQCLDRNFDTILVRIRATTTALVPLAIHWHCVHHLEIQHDAGSLASRYHSQCFNAPNLVSKVDAQIKKDPKASIIRSPNSFAYNP
jgi:hypothetical protein